jgi:hypothetical protein
VIALALVPDGVINPRTTYKNLVSHNKSFGKRITRSANMPSSEALYRDFTAKWGALREVTAFSIPSWLAIGASVQLLSQSWLPAGMGYWLPLLYIVYRAARVCVDSSRIFKSTFTDVKFGGWTAKLPEPEDPSAVTDTSDGVVMFLLGTRINQLVHWPPVLSRICDANEGLD